MLRVAASVMLAGSVVAVTTACGSSDEDGSDGGGEGTRIVDSAYGEIEVPEDPKRVAAVSFATPFQLRSLDVTPVATFDYEDFSHRTSDEEKEFLEPLEKLGVPRNLETELVALSEPDLIVGSTYDVDKELFDKLTGIAPTVIIEGEADGDWRGVLQQLSDVLDAGDALERTKTDYDDKMSELQEEYRNLLQENYFASIDAAAGAPANFLMRYPTNALGMVFEEVGMRMAPSIPESDAPSGSEEVSSEYIEEYLSGADFIVTPAPIGGEYTEGLQSIFDNAQFKSLPAAKNDRVYGVAATWDDYVSQRDFLERLEQNVLKSLSESME